MRVAEQVLQHEPGVAGPLADPAVHHHVVGRTQARLAVIDRLELGAGPEGGILGGRAGPRDAPCPRDVAAAHGAFLRVVGHVQQFAAVLAGRPHVDERLAEMVEHLVPERPELLVVAVHGGVAGRGAVRVAGADRTALGAPLGPAAVHQAHVRVPEQGADP